MRHPIARFTWSALLCACFVASQAAIAGPTWPEGPSDAGATPSGAQSINGPGAIFAIGGSLTGPPPPAPLSARGIQGDFQDMFLIRVVDANMFRASTDPDFDGFAGFDTQLFLFTGPDHPDGPGLGMFANDEAPMSTGGESLLNNNVNDGSSPPLLVSNVHYYLAISGFDSDPVSLAGAIFNQAIPEEFSGPDGPGGLDEIVQWSGNGDFGDYQIALQGVAAQTLCPNSDINGDGVTDSSDLGILIGQFNTTDGGPADLNFDGAVDTSDLGILIMAFGIVCP